MIEFHNELVQNSEAAAVTGGRQNLDAMSLLKSDHASRLIEAGTRAISPPLAIGALAAKELYDRLTSKGVGGGSGISTESATDSDPGAPGDSSPKDYLKEPEPQERLSPDY